MDRIRLFIDKLSKEISTPELTNVYSPEIPQSEVGKICIAIFIGLRTITVK